MLLCKGKGINNMFFLIIPANFLCVPSKKKKKKKKHDRIVNWNRKSPPYPTAFLSQFPRDKYTFLDSKSMTIFLTINLHDLFISTWVFRNSVIGSKCKKEKEKEKKKGFLYNNFNTGDHLITKFLFCSSCCGTKFISSLISNLQHKHSCL